MVSFDLADLTEGAVRKKGINLGIPNAEKHTKDHLIQEIKKITNSDGQLLMLPLVIAPLQPPSPPPQLNLPAPVVNVAVPAARRERLWFLPSSFLFLSSLAAAVTALLTFDIARSNSQSAKASSDAAQIAQAQYKNEVQKMRDASDKEIEILKADARNVWKEMAVYEILARGMKEKEHWNGLMLVEIQKRYKEEASHGMLAKEVDLGEKDFTDTAVKRVLFGLMLAGQVAETVEDRYVVQKYLITSPRWQNAANQILLSSAISQVLLGEKRTEPHTEESLLRAVAAKAVVRLEDYNEVLAEMQRLGQIKLENGKVWSPANPPSGKK